MLAFERVSRVFREGRTSRAALDDVSFAVERESLVAVVGPNGAGKTTLLRVAATLDEATSGRVSWGGAAVEPARARRRVAWLGSEPGLYDALTVRENLAFVARFFRREAEVPRAAAAMGVPLDARASTLSRGERQRAAIARALLAGDTLLLDEPTTALDEDGCSRLHAVLEARGGRTVLLATHEEALAKRCDRTLRLDGGRLA
jgi:ABC-type multidrug transport system ATPase subunit